MNTARLWLGRQWGSKRFAQLLEPQAGSARAAGRDDGGSRMTPGDGREARTAGRDRGSAAPRKSGK